MGQHDQPHRRRHVEGQHHRHARRQRLAQAGDIALCRTPRDRRHRGRGDRHTEEPERQIHQPVRVGQPRDRARAFPGCQPRVHEHVDLRRGEAKRPRPHQQQHLTKPRFRWIEARLVPVALAVERRHLHGELSETANQHADRHRQDDGKSDRRQDRHQGNRGENAEDVEDGGRQRGDEIAIDRVEHAHRGRGERHQDQKRHHHARQEDRQLDLPGHGREVAGEQHHERMGEDETRDRRW